VERNLAKNLAIKILADWASWQEKLAIQIHLKGDVIKQLIVSTAGGKGLDIS